MTTSHGTSAAQRRKLPLPPGSWSLPLVGETLSFFGSPTRFLDEHRRRYGRIFRARVMGSNMVFLIGPEANRWIFANEEKLLRNQWSPAIRRLLGDQSVAMLDGAEHRKRRQLLNPHFSRARTAALAPLIARIADAHLDGWAARGDVNVFSSMRALLFEVIATVLFGERGIDVTRLGALFEQWTAGMFVLAPIDLPFTTFGRALAAKRALMASIEARVLERERLAEQPDDLLGTILSLRTDADGRTLTTEAIVHELQLQLFAGHDTSVCALSNLMLLLSQHPDVLARARAELQPVDDAAPVETLEQLPYLNAVLFEGLRYLPPVAGAFRVALQDLEYEGYRIPKGWTIGLSIAGTHRDAPWTAPDRFDPDRFLDRSRAGQLSFIPFGGGPRLCLGQHLALTEMRLLLSRLLRRYDWQLVAEQDLRYVALPFPRPRSGIDVRFRKR